MQSRDQRGHGRGSDTNAPLRTCVESREARGQVPLRAPDPQRQRGSRVRARSPIISHGQGTHVVDAGAGTLDDGQGGGFANGCLSASLLPASSQALRKTQVRKRGVRFIHGGCDVGARGGGTQHGRSGVNEGFDTHPSTLGA